MAEKLIAENRKARHDYHLVERHEAGLALTGTEVKSLRDGRATLQRAYAEVRDGEASVFVRDWGVGFDLDAVAPDRHGVRDSIIDRMARHGGKAAVRTSPGEGTEVELRI